MVEHLFGLWGNDPESVREVSLRVGRAEREVRRIKGQALSKLRDYLDPSGRPGDADHELN